MSIIEDLLSAMFWILFFYFGYKASSKFFNTKEAKQKRLEVIEKKELEKQTRE